MQYHVVLAEHIRILLQTRSLCMKINTAHYSLFKDSYSSFGFTVIELLVVFSILAILSTIGIASFSSYANSQKLRSATLDISTMLQQARSQSQTQVKPNSCDVFEGYKVQICCVPSGSNCPTCLSQDNYELDAVCANAPNGLLISSGTFTSGVSIDTNGTTQRMFQFIPITGGVVSGGQIKIDGASSQTQTIKVSATGVIQ